jgi:methyl-accepting chemotaxis protein
MILIVAVYNYFNNYKIENNTEIAQKNKLLMMFSMTLELIVFCGFIIEVRFDGISTKVYAILALFVLISYVVNFILFMKNEAMPKLKNIILIELVIIYISTIVIAANWVFFVCLPMLAVCTIYGEDKLLKYIGITMNVTTLILAIQKVRIMDISENPVLYSGIYMAILAIYVLFVISIVDTSNMIGNINNKKLTEMLNKQNSVRKLSQDIIKESKDIKYDVQKTNAIVDEIEVISEKSSERFDEIAFKNAENSFSVDMQRQMTKYISEMIDDVKKEVRHAVSSTKSSGDILRESKESVEGRKDKSSSIIGANNEVLNAFDTLVSNIKNIKNTINEIENISDQTGMLSLNAYIESARTGSNKSEFDVVAGQINGLSESTHSLTNDMSSIVNNLEMKSAAVKEILANIMESVNEENNIIDNTINNFNNMDYKLQELENNIESISSEVNSVVKQSELIEEKSKLVKVSSEVIVEKTRAASNLNIQNQEKAIKTREVMNELVETVKELDSYIQEV